MEEEEFVLKCLLMAADVLTETELRTQLSCLLLFEEEEEVVGKIVNEIYEIHAATLRLGGLDKDRYLNGALVVVVVVTAVVAVVAHFLLLLSTSSFFFFSSSFFLHPSSSSLLFTCFATLPPPPPSNAQSV